MSLTELLRTGLPLNRKERFYTGTVFPMIVCANGFRDLSILASLIPGCKLPPVDTNPKSANIQFFTEYSLVESIFTKETKQRFPDLPITKDTPDVMILARGENSLLLAIEAKMYHQPQLHSLIKQLQAQQAQLDYLQRQLEIDVVHHAALLPQGYAETIGSTVALPGNAQVPIVTWESLLESYRSAGAGDEYFMGVLEVALRQWKELCSQLAFGANAEAKLPGGDIYRDYRKDPSLSIMGRNGGLHGPNLAQDIASGHWKTQPYEVSSAPKPINKNWFYVADFVRLVNSSRSGNPTEQAAAPSPAGKGQRWKMTGEQILVGQATSGIKTVGRAGGLQGGALANDILTGRWRTWTYEVSPESSPFNKNWFIVQEFVDRIEKDGDR